MNLERIYICEICHTRFESRRPEAEAREELATKFPGAERLSNDERSVICDTCLKKLQRLGVLP
jgi:hypothetical protein